MAQYNIDTSKIYNFPSEIKTVRHRGKILIIAPEEANWIVLDTLQQLEIFNMFHIGQSIEEVVHNTKFEYSDIKKVVTQIEARRFFEITNKEEIPTDKTMHLYLTNKCNLSCPHCYMFSGKAYEDELSTIEIKKLICDFAQIGNGTEITLSGGEPSIRTDFEEIVKTAYEMGLEVKLLTNGTQLSSERIAQLSNYISFVQVSIDGFSEESNAHIRGKGNFSKALATVDDFISNGVFTAIAITPSVDNLKKHFDDYISFAQNLSEKYNNKSFELRFSEEILNGRCISDAENINKEYSKMVSNIQKVIYGPDFKLYEFVKTLTDNPKISNCSFGNLTVSSTGDVFLCPRISDLKPIGNVKTTDFKLLLQETEYAQTLTSITELEPCKRCDLRYICGGGCRIEEFPKLVFRSTFSSVIPSDYPRKECVSSQKEVFYDLMIQSNEYFYKE